MKTFRIQKPHGFRLAAAADFYAGFVPGSGMAAAAVDHLTLAFRLDRSFEPVAAALREDGESLLVEYEGTRDERALAAQLSRILGLDVDGRAWLAIGARDPVVGTLQAEFPGFFTAAKSSPYDAATWAVIAPRMNIQQAAKVKVTIARELGDTVSLLGHDHVVFPSPEKLAKLTAFPGLSDEKVTRLRGVAEAAIAGKLDVDRLRGMPAHEALIDLQSLRGIGPWAASHVLFRGAAPPNALPLAEPRVLHGLALAYGLDAPTFATFERIAESWRPFRMWVCVLLSRHLAQSGAWKVPGLARERAAAGREVTRRAARAGNRGLRPTG